jgi:hypothetical protein
MKNIKITILISIFFGCILLTNQSSAFDLIYKNNSDWYLYKKSANDTSNWTAITSVPSNYPAYSPDWNFVVYVNVNDGNKLYKKSVNDTSNWTAITSVGAYYPTFSFDWNDIFYTQTSNIRIYKKSANDTSNWTAITSVDSYQISVSPDWNDIVYVNWSNWYLYKKSANDTSNWTAITSVSSNYPAYSPDWNFIIYRQQSTWATYKKSANDTSNWTAIITWSQHAIYSPDWEYIVYSNQNDGNKLYKKSANDTSNWTAITSFNSLNPTSYRIFENCLDWILNQDETEIDFGGICGTCSDWIQQTDVTNPEISIDYGWRCTTSQEYRFDWCTQRTIKYYWTGATTVYNMWGLSNYSLFVADVSNESEWLKVFWLWQSKIEQYTFDDWTGLNYDLFKVYNIQYSDSTAEMNNPQVNSGSLVVTSGGPLSAIKTDTTTGTPPSIEIYSMRSGVVRKFDFVRFTGANYPTITKWSQTNYAGYVTWNTQKGIISSPLVLSGWIATAYLSDWLLADSAVINLQQQNSKFNGVYFQFSGFSFWLSWWSLSVTECWNGDFKCKMYVESPTASPVCKPDSNSVLWIWEACVYTTAFTTPVVINDAGDITTVSW